MDISLISVNYNSADETIAMAERVITMTDSTLEYEIIIVDNASETEDFHKLSVLHKHKSITIVSSRINGGFAQGNMLGIEHAQGDYYLFLNNDTLLDNDALRLFYDFMQEHSDAGLCTGTLFNAKREQTSSFKQFPSLLGSLAGYSLLRAVHLTPFPSNKAILTTATPVSVVSGACMFFRAEVFDALGGFDTHFFLYCEEEDISKRVWNAGFKVYALPEAHIMHYEGASTQKSYAIEREYYLSHHLLINKHFNFLTIFIMRLLLVFKLARRSFRAKHYFKLLLFVLRGSPLKESLRYHNSLKELR